jgi:hypothetical protein
MYDDSRPASELREALNAVCATGSIREALDDVYGTAPEPDESAVDFSWVGSGRAPQRRWPRQLGLTLVRVDVLILIATVACAIIAYLALVKPN